MKIYYGRVPTWMAKGFMSPVDRAVKEIEALGYKFVRAVDKPDVSIIQLGGVNSEKIDELVKNTKAPIIIQEFLNDSTFNWFHLLKDPKVIGYIKPQVHKDMDNYKFNYPFGRYHYHLISPEEEITLRDDITDKMLEKVHIGWNMGLIDRPGSSFNDDDIDGVKDVMSIKKKFDIHFSMTLQVNVNSGPDAGGTCRYYKKHRGKLQKEINRLCKEKKYKQSGYHKSIDYRKTMMQSKVCVGAFGMGEVCHRTFEAIRMNAIPICPDMSHIETWPDIFIPWKTYVPCATDFSDLKYVLEEVLDNYDSYTRIIKKGQKIMYKAWENKVFAKQFDEIIKGIMK